MKIFSRNFIFQDFERNSKEKILLESNSPIMDDLDRGSGRDERTNPSERRHVGMRMSQ